MWTKLFISGETICEPNSWSRTALNEMVGCILTHNDLRVEIHGAGEYWQSDTFVANLESGIAGSRFN